MPSSKSRVVALVGIVTLAAGFSASAAEFVLPRFILTGGSSYGHEVVLQFAYTGETEATLALTLLNSSGQPLLSSSSQPVCNPCLFELDGGLRQRKIRFSDLVVDAGGLSGALIGLARLSTTGDVANLSLHVTTVQLHSGPTDFRAQDQPLIEVGPGLGSPPIAMFDHLPEEEGSVLTGGHLDSWVELAYVGSMAVDFDLYLRTPPLGAPLRSALGNDVCYPCSFHLDPSLRVKIVSVNGAIESAGGFSAPELEIWGEIVASGDIEQAAVAAKVVSTPASFYEGGFESFVPAPVAVRAPDVAVFCDGFEHGDALRWGVFP